MTRTVGSRIASPDSREIYYFSEIFAAEATGTPEDAAKAFQEACQIDLDEEVDTTPPPASGSTILMRERSFKRDEENEWFSVKVP